MKKKNKLFAVIATCSFVAAAAIIVASNGNSGKLAQADSGDNYKITLNSGNTLTSDEQSAKAFTRNTHLGNPVTFGLSGAQPWGSGFFQTHGNEQGIYNTSAILGLRTIKVVADSDKAYSLLFGTESQNYVYKSENIVGTGAVQEYMVPQYETPFSFFRLQSENGAWMHYTSVEILYSCSNTLAPRGEEYAPADGGGIELDEDIDIATGVVNVDIKRTIVGPNNGQVCVNLMQRDWNAGFDYKSLFVNTKTGDFPGLTVIPLSDGYTRYSWKLSEMAGGSPSTIGRVHIHKTDAEGGWTSSTGYFDVNNSIAVTEFKGSKFTPTGLTINLDSPVSLATGKIQVDVYYMTKGQISTAIMDDWSNNHYGYFTVQSTGNYGEIYGLTVVSQTNGFVRLTFEASKISASKKNGTPTEINMVYLRETNPSSGGWTTASGYVNVTVLSY